MRKSYLAGLAAAIGVITLLPNTAAADQRSQGRTLADVLLADAERDDEAGFDRRPWDFDIVTQAALLFPDIVAAAADPAAELTVFLPTDQAFRQLVKDLTGEWVWSEADVFGAVAGLGTDTVLAVLSYHIVPQKISYRDAKRADGAVLETLNGAAITVAETRRSIVQLGDIDTDDRDPIVVAPNVGGRLSNGYAHGIDRVLRPVDLP